MAPEGFEGRISIRAKLIQMDIISRIRPTNHSDITRFVQLIKTWIALMHILRVLPKLRQSWKRNSFSQLCEERDLLTASTFGRTFTYILNTPYFMKDWMYAGYTDQCSYSSLDALDFTGAWPTLLNFDIMHQWARDTSFKQGRWFLQSSSQTHAVLTFFEIKFYDKLFLLFFMNTISHEERVP